MTKEEHWIKESIENYIFAYTGKRTKISDADAKHFTASVISYLNLCTPSIPSNLDEAAEKIASDIVPTYPDIGWDECFEKIKEGIKAGAEWMAGQMPKWKPAARAYEGDRLPRYDWQLDRIVARDEDGIYYLPMADLYRLPKAETK